MSIQAASDPRPAWWSEGLVAVAGAPGAIAAATLCVGLTLDHLGWRPDLGPVAYVLAWVAVFSPALVLFGAVTLLGGVAITSFGPRRRRRKLVFLIAGTLA